MNPTKTVKQSTTPYTPRIIRPATIRRALTMTAATVICFIFAIPFLWMILTSLKLPGDLFTSPVRILPQEGIYWQAYTEVWIRGNFSQYFVNSVTVSSLATLVSVTIAVLAALGFSRYTLIGGKYLLLGVLLSTLFPLALLVPPFFVVMRQFGILNTHLSIIVTYTSFALPFSIWMLTGYFRSIPVNLEESAMVDGATRFGAYLRITLPLAVPGIIATVIYCFILAWNEFLFAFTFLSSRNLLTLPVGLRHFIGEYHTEWNLLMAGSVITTVPVAVLFVVIQRYLIAGLTAGSVKG